MRVQTMILGGPRGEESIDGVRAVVERAGFEGPCTADLHAQGEGIWIVLITIPPTAFLAGFSAEAGKDAWKRVKQFMGELREALKEKRGSHGQLYLRANVVTGEEWERSKPHGPMPGWPKPGDDGDQLTIDTLMSDAEFQGLFDSDAAGSLLSRKSKRRSWPVRLWAAISKQRV
jgi:hypothetical protein